MQQINYDSINREKLLKGIEQLSKVVVSTLGPKGRTVIIDKEFGNPLITKDGVNVAKEVNLDDPIENLGNKVVKEVSIKTGDIAGDGTTTSILLASEIVKEGFKNITAGANPMDLKRGIDLAVKEVINELRKNISRPIKNKEEIAQVGAISANNDKEIGDLIADAMDKIGKNGVITVEESRTIDTTIEIVEGMKFDKGYLSHHFINNKEKGTVVFENPLFFLYDKKINSLKEILKVLELVSQQQKNLVLIAEDFEGDSLPGMIINVLRGALKVVAVKAPGFGDSRKEMLEDIATLTNGIVLSEEKGYKLDSVKLEYLGTAKKVIIDNDSTTIIEGAATKDKILNRISDLKIKIENSKSDFDKEKLHERIAKLSGGVAILRVGALSELEMKEKKARIEDALHATKAAVEEGIVPGGGIALIRTINVLNNIQVENEDQRTGVNIIRKVLSSPLKAIAQNAGVNGEVIFNEVIGRKGAVLSNKDENIRIDYGYNAQTGEYGNLYEMGVIDPAKVTRVALENASSIASTLLTSQASIVNIKEKENNQQMPDMSQLGMY